VLKNAHIAPRIKSSRNRGQVGKTRGYAHCSFFEFEEVDEAESVADDYGLGVGEG